ncbi:MAG: molybdopterin oxidoreductase family protein, partial [Candidatus Acidiferrales bacterium]
TLSVRNNEILRANNRDHSGVNGEFLCGKGRFGFDFTKHPERIRQPLVRKNGKLEPASWEDALEVVSRRLKQVHEKHGGEAIGVIGSNRTTNEENYLLNRFARISLGTNNLDHHRTADYAGLIEALGPKAESAMATMAQIDSANSILLIGNDPSQQNPLVAWQIRSAVRHHGARLYSIHSKAIKLHRQSTQFVEMTEGAEPQVARWLAGGSAELDGGIIEKLANLKAAVEKERDVVILFGAELAGAALRDLMAFASKLPGETRCMALGDYINSRGAADMGVFPDRLPGYSRLSDAGERKRFGKLWGGEVSEKPGMNAREMMDAAVGKKLKALYVLGANPVKTFGLKKPERLSGLELLVVHEMFLTETAERADVVLPAACAYEKDGSVTNTAGELQLTHRALDPQGPRSDYDLLRILSHQLASLGMGSAIRLRTPEAALDEIRQHVHGYKLPLTGLLTGGAE